MLHENIAIFSKNTTKSHKLQGTHGPYQRCQFILATASLTSMASPMKTGAVAQQQRNCLVCRKSRFKPQHLQLRGSGSR